MKFENLDKLVAHCTDPAGNGFYRDLYGVRRDAPALHIRTREDWHALPFLTKDALLARSFRERIFLPNSEIDHLRPSSGTSGKPPLFSPRTELRGMEYRLQYHDFKNAILAYTVPAMPHWHEQFQKSHGLSPRVVVFDPRRAAASVRLARDAGVDSVSLFAFHIPLVAGHMVREKINTRIKYIELAGEAVTRLLFDFIRATFPNAVIIPFYGSSEVEDSPIGMPCRAITGEEPLSVYHAKESQYHELLDPGTMQIVEPEIGAEGELVITAYPGKPSSFPLLRFRVGDTVRVVENPCPAHGTWSFTILGRTAMDFMKIPGGLLRADEIGRVLRTLQDRVSDRFELHCFERQTPVGPLLEPVLHVEPRGVIDMKILAKDISHLLRVAPSFTYSDGVAQRRYLPLACTLLQIIAGQKTKRIVRH